MNSSLGQQVARIRQDMELEKQRLAWLKLEKAKKDHDKLVKQLTVFLLNRLHKNRRKYQRKILDKTWNKSSTLYFWGSDDIRIFSPWFLQWIEKNKLHEAINDFYKNSLDEVRSILQHDTLDIYLEKGCDYISMRFSW